MKSFRSLLPSLVALVFLPSIAHADPVFWVDWTTTTGTGVTGTMTVGDAVITATYTGQYYTTTQVNGGGTNYWTPSTPYVSATVDNAPPGTDIVTISVGGARSITFSTPVRNPIFAVVSLNGNGYEFDTDFVILSQGAGFFGTGTLAKSTLPNGHFRLDGVNGEPHGAIEFQGVVSQVNWTAGSEIWNGFSMAARGVGCLGSKGTPALATGEECTVAELPVCQADGLCVGPAANGDPIPANPNDLAPYLGVCNAADGALLCASTVCSVADNLCGLPNGASAVDSAGAPTANVAVCRSGAIDADGKCGLLGGGACLTAAVCRGGLCDESGVCGIRNGSPAASADLCISRALGMDGNCGLANGELGCTDVSAALVCRSGKCDAATSTCGLAEGATCDVDGDCLNNACADDNVCGLVLGDTCTPNPANDPCRGALACDAVTLLCDTDTDADGLTDTEEQTLGTDPTKADTDGDGISDGTEVGPDAAQPINTDDDGLIDALDEDDDNDGVLTVDEIAAATAAGLPADLDGDGVSNWLDADANGDGIADSQQTGDANENGIPDYLDLPIGADAGPDAGGSDGGRTDGGSSGAGPTDAGRVDAGRADGGGSSSGAATSSGEPSGDDDAAGIETLGGGSGCAAAPRTPLDVGGLLGLGLALTAMLRRRQR